MGSWNVSHREVIRTYVHTYVSLYVCVCQQDYCIFTLQGKIEMEMEILTELEAKSRPAGRGRGEPNNHPFLPEPK